MKTISIHLDRITDRQKSAFASKSNPVPSGCIEWSGRRDRQGYGHMRLGERTVLAHRLAWVLAGKELVSGMVLEHLCRNTSCVNADHLEVVTHRVNTLRGTGTSAANAEKTHCLRGHPFDQENTYLFRKGSRWHRQCKTCNRTAASRHSAKRLAQGVLDFGDAS